MFLRENMERREFVAGIGGLAASGWIEVGDKDAENDEIRTDEVLARKTVQETTHVPVRLKEGASVTVEINVKEGSGFSVAVMSLNGMNEKTVEEEGELVAEIEEDGEYLVDVSGDGTAEVRVVRS
jgi:predicted DNA-binding antitoxin AbrB/MazE fold protein